MKMTQEDKNKSKDLNISISKDKIVDLRMECVKLVHADRNGFAPSFITELADTLLQYVIHGTVQFREKQNG